jgi:hypothetical protein
LRLAIGRNLLFLRQLPVYLSAARRKPMPTIASRPGEAGGLVMFAEHLHLSGLDAKFRRLVGIDEKISYLGIKNEVLYNLKLRFMLIWQKQILINVMVTHG